MAPGDLGRSLHRFLRARAGPGAPDRLARRRGPAQSRMKVGIRRTPCRSAGSAAVPDSERPAHAADRLGGPRRACSAAAAGPISSAPAWTRRAGERCAGDHARRASRCALQVTQHFRKARPRVDPRARPTCAQSVCHTTWPVPDVLGGPRLAANRGLGVDWSTIARRAATCARRQRLPPCRRRVTGCPRACRRLARSAGRIVRRDRIALRDDDAPAVRSGAPCGTLR